MAEQRTIDPGLAAIDRERANGRRRQARKVMPLIGPLLDAWETLPNDLKGDDELIALAHYLRLINAAMEDA